MKFLIALPDHDYYLWQMLVQMNNMKKLGFDKDTIYVISKTNQVKSENLSKIIKGNETQCSFYVYQDDRTDYIYSSASRPNTLKKLFRDVPKLRDEAIFYIDPDVIFTKKIRFNDLTENDTWYLSDTRSYIDTNYIKSKSEELFHRMCAVVGIDPLVVENNNLNAGGAQYLMKNVDGYFWDKVERNSNELYRLMTQTTHIYSPDSPIQAWTADMWAVLWNAWLLGHKTKIIKRFDFSWATDPTSMWKKRGIFHNAGAVDDMNGQIFAKVKHQTYPFGKDLISSDKYCVSKYVEEIRETEKTFKNIL